jgi:hypothetical protein
MLKLEAWMDIKDLYRQGHSIRTIAEMTGQDAPQHRAARPVRASASYRPRDATALHASIPTSPISNTAIPSARYQPCACSKRLD